MKPSTALIGTGVLADSDGNIKKFIWLNAACDRKRHPTLAPVNRA